ncbi:deoxyribodipyrimidine photo-lyase, partial [Rubrivirga sp.]|uniref:deoxyribodipyrimidine photo-lyase n=1 Tax=Rubrivirga sp. TaxID=1885344 RepID=UPI003C75FCF9
MPTSLLWLRHDLRLHDHGPLTDALEAAGPDGHMLAVYVIDPRDLEETDLGFRKTEAYRMQFVLESLHDLRRRMSELGGDLIVRVGKPEEVIPALAGETGATIAFVHDEPMREERDLEDAVRDATPGLEWRATWGHTLVDLEDLPFRIEDAPDVFTPFRKKVEQAPAQDRYRAPELAPDALPPPPPGLEVGEIPTLADLGLETVPKDERNGLRIRGGETEGLARLHAYFWDLDRLRTYKETRNGMLDPDDSS